MAGELDRFMKSIAPVPLDEGQVLLSGAQRLMQPDTPLLSGTTSNGPMRKADAEELSQMASQENESRAYREMTDGTELKDAYGRSKYPQSLKSLVEDARYSKLTPAQRLKALSDWKSQFMLANDTHVLSQAQKRAAVEALKYQDNLIAVEAQNHDDMITNTIFGKAGIQGFDQLYDKRGQFQGGHFMTMDELGHLHAQLKKGVLTSLRQWQYPQERMDEMAKDVSSAMHDKLFGDENGVMDVTQLLIEQNMIASRTGKYQLMTDVQLAQADEDISFQIKRARDGDASLSWNVARVTDEYPQSDIFPVNNRGNRELRLIEIKKRDLKPDYSKPTLDGKGPSEDDQIQKPSLSGDAGKLGTGRWIIDTYNMPRAHIKLMAIALKDNEYPHRTGPEYQKENERIYDALMWNIGHGIHDDYDQTNKSMREFNNMGVNGYDVSGDIDNAASSLMKMGKSRANTVTPELNPDNFNRRVPAVSGDSLSPEELESSLPVFDDLRVVE